MMTKSRSQTAYYNSYTGALVYPYDWQLKIQKGDYFRVVTEYYPTVYGEILEPFREVGYYHVRAYSEWCLGGQEGTLCVVEPTRILTQKEFEEARSQCWKTEEVEVQ
jgi:hypothetical protein